MGSSVGSESSSILPDYDLQAGISPESRKLHLAVHEGDLDEIEFSSYYMALGLPVLISGEMSGWRAMQCTCQPGTIGCHCWRHLDYIKESKYRLFCRP
jgi:hypothetical protein